MSDAWLLDVLADIARIADQRGLDRFRGCILAASEVLLGDLRGRADGTPGDARGVKTAPDGTAAVICLESYRRRRAAS